MHAASGDELEGVEAQALKLEAEVAALALAILVRLMTHSGKSCSANLPNNNFVEPWLNHGLEFQ